MITDPTALQNARDGWEFVRRSRNVIVGNCNVVAISSAISFNQSAIRDLCFNLLLASAFSVLEKALEQLRKERRFSGGGSNIGPLMTKSRQALPWVDWCRVDEGRVKRNDSIHRRKYLPHGECRDYIAAIEKELVAWGVLTSASPELWHW